MDFLRIIVTGLLFLLQLSIFPAGVSEIIYTKGEATVERMGENLAAYQRMKIHNNDLITSGEDGLVIIRLINGATIKVDPGTSLEIVIEVNSQEGSSGLINLIRGSILSNFKKSEQSNLEIKVKNFAMGVRGTRFLVSAPDADEENLTLAVERGEVNIYDFENNDFEPVNAGKAVVIDSDNRMTKPFSYQWIKDINWNVDDIQ